VSHVLLPLYVQRLLKQTALWAGLVLGLGGMITFFIMPVVGLLIKKGINLRNLLGLGLISVAYSLWLMSGCNLEASFWDIVWPRVILGVVLGLFFVPLGTAAFATISKKDMSNASGIFYLLRNIGGRFGAATSTAILTRRAQMQHSFLVEHITPHSLTFQEYYEWIQQWLAGQRPDLAFGHKPLAVIYQRY
jgi:DHA2 family multidrug resistance protein